MLSLKVNYVVSYLLYALPMNCKITVKSKLSGSKITIHSSGQWSPSVGKPRAVSGCGELRGVSILISLNMEMDFYSGDSNVTVWLQSTTSRTFSAQHSLS